MEHEMFYLDDHTNLVILQIPKIIINYKKDLVQTSNLPPKRTME